MRFVSYQEFIELPDGIPFIDTEDDGVLRRRGKVVSAGKDFYYEQLAIANEVAESQELPLTAGGYPIGTVADDLELNVVRDGAYDYERTFMVLDTPEAKLAYFDSVTDLLNLESLDDSSKQEFISVLASKLLAAARPQEETGALATPNHFTF